MDNVGFTSAISTAKEDRDYLLDYKSIDLSNLNQKDILDVPIDSLSRDESVALILDMIEKRNGPHHVMFLDPIKLMRIRPNRKLNHLMVQSRLLLPDGAGLMWASNKLGHPLKERIPMIALLMDIIRLAEKKELTVYLLGSKMEYVERVFFNLQRSFPGVRIIGRQSGFFDSEREGMIKEALRKSSPDIVFVGMGFPYQEEWINQNMEIFSKAIVFGVDGAFDILSGKEKKAPDWIQLRGLIWLWRIISRPWRMSRIIFMIQFYILTYFRSFRQGKK